MKKIEALTDILQCFQLITGILAEQMPEDNRVESLRISIESDLEVLEG